MGSSDKMEDALGQQSDNCIEISTQNKIKNGASNNKIKVVIAIATAVLIGVGVTVGVMLAGGSSDTNSKGSSAAVDGELPGNDPSKPPEGTTTMPNIGFLFAGYDLMRGNPIATGVGGVVTNDPGLKGTTFDSTFTELQTTQDLRYTLPDNISVRSCSGCQLDFSSTIMASTTDYTNKLSTRASISTSYKSLGFKAKISASAAYDRVKKEIFGTESTVIHSEASCCAYEAEIQQYTLPDFHPNFLSALAGLPEEYDQRAYSSIIDSFGTHHVQKTSIGALFGEQSFMTKQNRETFESHDFSIEVAASASGWGASGSVQAGSEKNVERATTFRSATSGRQTYTRGSLPPADGNAVTWANTAIENPAPISLQLNRIDNLPLPVSASVLSNYGRAIDGYCQLLAAEGLIASCNPGDQNLTDFAICSIDAVSLCQ